MKKKIYKLISQLYNNKIIRYIFFGGLTTLVNLVCYYLLRQLANIEINTANVISIALAILFAFVVNSKYVFKSKSTTLKEHAVEFIKFVSARLSTMAIEIGGMWLLTACTEMNDMIAKVAIQFIVLVLNYIFSKLLVFKK